MRLLLDTHMLIWWLDEEGLPAAARDAIKDPANELLISVATIWEIAIKSRLGKLEAPDGLLDELARQGFSILPVSATHAWATRELPLHHRDPFDRLLVAQARVEGLTLVTSDARIGAYDVPTLGM